MHKPRKLFKSAVLGLLICLSCADRQSSYHGPKVLVIGMDGLEWSVLEPLMDSGRAPNFKALVERGIGGEIKTMVPTFSPVLWTTMATGVGPRQHGILHFAELREDGSFGLPYTSNTRKVPAIWNIAGEHQRSVLSTGWWVSWPAEEVNNGRVIASYAAQAQGAILWKSGVWDEGLPDLTWPRGLIDELYPALEAGSPEGPLRGEFNQLFGVIKRGGEWEFPWGRDRLFRVGYHGDRTHHRIMCEQLSKEVADLNLVYYGLADVAGHFFWRYREPGAFSYHIPKDQVEILGDRIDRTYEVLDSWLGELLQTVPADTMVMVVSDHGMHAANTGDSSAIQSGAHEDAPNGVFIAAGDGVKSRGLLPPGRRQLTHVLEIAPTLLDWLNLPLAADMPGKSARRLMDEAWLRSHPEQQTASYADGFRAATTPRVPRPGLNEEFLTNIKDIGYMDDEN